MTQIIQPAASDWLALRRPADRRARQASLRAVAKLDHHLAARSSQDEAVSIVDLGAGTGANMAWLAPRLTVPQRWTLVDRDQALLDLAAQSSPSDLVLEVRRLAVELDELQREQGVIPQPDLVTCSAFLDVLTVQQVHGLCAHAVRTGTAALFSLTVTGIVRLEPELESDARLDAAFNAHQRRHGLAGPTATTVAAETLRASGLDVDVIDTPWVLRSGQESLAERYLRDRIASVVEHDEMLAGAAHDWLATRLSQLRRGELTIQVGHRDLLAMPLPRQN